MPRHSPETFLAACPPGPLLGLDVSAKRIGLAITDPARTMALPLMTLNRGKWAADAARLIHIIQDKNVAGLVIGIPLLADGSVGPAAQSRLTFGRNLDIKCTEQSIDLQYVFTDESLTSHAAHEDLEGRGSRTNAGDPVAACLILQQFLKIL
jgi:putative Holliday junction resolvase